MRLDDASRWLRSRSQIEQTGVPARTLAAHVRHGRLHRVDRGWYVDGASWREWSTEDRHLIRVIAAQRRRGGGTAGGVFSHVSAAVLWGLPLARCEPPRVHVSGAATNGHVRAGEPAVARHEVSVEENDVAVIGGMRCTSLPRTVADVLRSSSEETGISLLDAALRAVAGSGDFAHYDETAAEDLREEVARRLPPGARGVRRARALLEMGDGRAQLPGESISRLYLRHIGFAPPRLQVPIDGPRGTRYFADFGLDDAGVWGEFDGRAKYLDPAVRGTGIDVAATILAEKEREDWIRGTTGRRVVRWTGQDIRDAGTLRARLAAFRVFPRSQR